jgi:hypothetical protein
MVVANGGAVTKRTRDTVALGQEDMQTLFEEDLDVHTRSLNQSQFESLVILLANRHKMTVKAIQRTLEYSYIFEFLEETKKELDEESTKLYHKLLDGRRPRPLLVDKSDRHIEEWKETNIVAQKQKILDRVLNDGKHIKDKLLRRELDVYVGVQPVGEACFGGDMTGFKNFMLSNDSFGTPEIKRAGVISEINKHSSLRIPSYNTISNGLEDLRFNGYLEYISAKTLRKNEEKVRTRANGVWQVTDIFYRAWNKRRLDILNDYQRNASIPDANKDAVLADIVEKYSARVLDIYLIKVSERIKNGLSSSIYLIHQAQVAEVFRD